MVLKKTTKMSLNERFTAYRAQASSSKNHPQKLEMERQASSDNFKLLAQQIANLSTAVAAALRIKKRSLQQRLGRRQQSVNGNIKSGLNFGGKRLNNQSVQGRLGSIRGRGGARRGGLKSGTSPLIKYGLATFGQYTCQIEEKIIVKEEIFEEVSLEARQARSSWWNNRTGGNIPSKQELDNQLDEYMAGAKNSGAPHGGVKFGASPLIKDRLGLPTFGLKKKFIPNQRGNFRKGHKSGTGCRQQHTRGRYGLGHRGNLRSARGQGSSWWNNRNEGNIPSKQELDNQLDDYMAGTKKSLEAQLEHYMSQN